MSHSTRVPSTLVCGPECDRAEQNGTACEPRDKTKCWSALPVSVVLKLALTPDRAPAIVDRGHLTRRSGCVSSDHPPVLARSNHRRLGPQ